MDGLVAKETTGTSSILPIWHNLKHEDVFKYSPPLADRVAVTTSSGVENVVRKILEVVHSQSFPGIRVVDEFILQTKVPLSKREQELYQFSAKNLINELTNANTDEVDFADGIYHTG